MCYSNCKNERNDGTCENTPSKHSIDIDLHCFEGFVCKHCGEIYPDTQYMSNKGIVGGNICLDCE